MAFSGSFVALITPFDRKGRLDTKALEKLVEWHINEGTDGIVCSATTGEGLSFSDLERKKIAQICIETAARRIPVIVSTGVSDTRISTRYTEMAKRLGADGCLVVTPYYNKPSQRGCVIHFQEVAKVGLPIIIYHNPPRAVVRLSGETIEELSQIPNVVGIKESSHDLELVRRIAKRIPVFSGDDDLTYSILREGGVGAIAVTANVIPRGWKRLVSSCLQGEWEKGSYLMKRFLPLCRAMFLETNPQGPKFAASWLGLCKPVLRLPMILPMDATRIALKKEILRLALPYLNVNSSLVK